MDAIGIALTSAGIALAALAISAVSLWRTHFAMPRPIVIPGRLRFRIYPIKGEGERWYIGSFDLPLSVCNPGAQPLLVSDLRLRLHFPKLPIPDNEELLPAKWTIDPNSAQGIDQNRFEWIDKMRPCDWMPSPVMSKSAILQHVLFETRWNEPVIQSSIQIELQIKWTGSSKFHVAARWNEALPADVWGELTNKGTSIVYTAKGEVELSFGLCNPPDLHKYTGSKEEIPRDGFGGGPSYLDFPKPIDKVERIIDE